MSTYFRTGHVTNKSLEMSGFKISRENMPRDGQYAKSLGNNASCGFFHGCFMQFYKLLPGLLAVLSGAYCIKFISVAGSSQILFMCGASLMNPPMNGKTWRLPKCQTKQQRPAGPQEGAQAAEAARFVSLPPPPNTEISSTGLPPRRWSLRMNWSLSITPR